MRTSTAACILCLVLLTAPIAGQSGARNGEWRTYGGDLGNTRYAPLDQINAVNFNTLEVAWRFNTDNLGSRPEYNFQSTPLMVGGVIYSTAGSRRAVVALDGRTGELLWMHSVNEGARADEAPRNLSGRGLSYWTDGRDARIFYVTIGYQLVALDAKTGVRISDFGNKGLVDLKTEMDQFVDPVTGEVGLHAAPIVVKDTILIGAAHRGGGAPKSRTNVRGVVRGYDARSGKRLWLFNTIPRLGEFGNKTWEGDSWAYTGNTGVWAQMSADEELGLVYLPVETPTGDYYGGHRHGDGLFGDSIVAVDVTTGKRVWHFQLVHHGLWDYDTPAAPILADIVVDGRPIKAVAVPTKQSFMYVFDRATGAPVWPIEERPVPQSTIPGERTSGTQPFPTKPPPFDRQGISLDDLIDFTPELRAEATKIASRYQLGPLYTPPVASKPEGPIATLVVPSQAGGANWPGGAFDPETGIVYVHSATQVSTLGLVNNPKASDMDYVLGGSVPGIAMNPDSGGFTLTVQGLPILRPPWGRMTAIDLNQGRIVWQVPHGDTPANVAAHPALKGVAIPRTGRAGRVGTLVTKSLVIVGDVGFSNVNGVRGSLLRAYDKATGKDAGAVLMPAPQTGSPMTYMLDGKQYLLVAISGGIYGGELRALRLP